VGAAYLNDTPGAWQHFVKKFLHEVPQGCRSAF